MGLMDRVKAQASQLAQQAMDATQEGKAKLDQVQAQRRGEAMLRQLGAAVFAERTGRGTPDSQAKIDQLVNAISAHEQANGLNLTTDPASAPGGQPPFQPGQAPGSQPPFQPGQAPGAEPPFQAGQAPGAEPPFQAGQAPGGQDPYQGGAAPFQGPESDAGAAPPQQGPMTINQGPFFSAPDPNEEAPPQ
jgi:hypothetical protein